MSIDSATNNWQETFLRRSAIAIIIIYIIVINYLLLLFVTIIYIKNSLLTTFCLYLLTPESLNEKNGLSYSTIISNCWQIDFIIIILALL